MEKLTPRELEVVKLLVTGSTLKQIAGALEVSEQTVKNYSTSLRRKLGATTLAHAVFKFVSEYDFEVSTA